MMRLPWHGKTAPHAVLDILRGCNCRCANCYNATAPLNCKSLDALKEELVLLRSARNLSAISLSGGEPLMHPEVAEIVDWLHHREGLTVNTLTNGILLDDAMAERLARAGLGMITIHVQKGQKRPDATDATIDDLRREKGRIARRHGLFPALDETIEPADGESFRRFGEFLRATPEYEYALVTMARDFSEIRSDRAQEDVDPSTMLESFRAAGYEPSVFVGGRYERNAPRWYVLQSTQAIDREGRERDWDNLRPGLLERAFLYGLAFFGRRSVHWIRSTSAKLKVRLLVNGLTGGHLRTFWFALKATVCGWKLLEKHIIVQRPPYSLGDGRIEFCDGCPDATIRNGRLHPLCLGDLKEEVPL